MEINNQSIYHERNQLDKEKSIKEESIRKRRRRIAILGIVMLLGMLSMINMISASFFMKPGNIKKHFIYLIIFFITYLIVGNFKVKTFNYTFLNKKRINSLIFLGSIMVLVFMYVASLLKLPIVPYINGAYGWISFGGITIQPAEIIKIAFIIIMANLLSRCEEENCGQSEIIVQSTITFTILFSLIMLQKDLGTGIHYFTILIFMLFMTKIKKSLILKTVIPIMSVGILGLYLVYKHASEEGAGYKIMRIKSYVDGLFYGSYSEQYGYQVKQSIYAFGSGGIFGKGYANGVQKYSYLPEIHTDFAMATFGEEFGIIGMLAIIVLFYIMFSLIMITGVEAKTSFGKFLAVGIAGLIITQMIINIFVAVGLLPVFGIPMPLFSYGGSSMVTMGLALGIIHNINRE